MRKIRIVSDGTTEGTQVLDYETFEPIANVQAIEFLTDVNDYIRCRIEFGNVPVDIECLAEEKIDAEN